MLPLLMSITFTNDDPGFFADLANWLLAAFVAVAAATGLGAVAAPRLAGSQIVTDATSDAASKARAARTGRMIGIALAMASVVSMAVSAVIWVGLHSAEYLGALDPTPTQQSDPVIPGPTPSASESPQESPPEAPALVSVPVTAVNGVPATAYVGQQGAVRQAMDDLGVTLNQAPGLVDAYPQLCAETVVVGPVEGVEGTVIAAGLAGGWGSLEEEHTPEVSYDGGLLHQELVSPPEGLAVGDRFRAAAKVVVDGAPTYSAPFDLEVTARSGLSVTWRVADAGTVTCDVTR